MFIEMTDVLVMIAHTTITTGKMDGGEMIYRVRRNYDSKSM